MRILEKSAGKENETTVLGITMKSRALDDLPFHFQTLKNDRLQIFHKGRLAVTLTDRRAIQTLQKLEQADGHNAQLIMAKVTGQFKFGNEKSAKKQPGII